MDRYFAKGSLEAESANIIAGIIAQPASMERLQQIRTLPETPENRLVLSYALAKMAESGVHVEDVHFDSREALEVFQSLALAEVGSLFIEGGYEAYRDDLNRLWRRCRAFAERQGLPLEKASDDYADYTPHQLNSAAYLELQKDPKQAAYLYQLARDKAAEDGEDANFFECCRVLAVAQAEVSEDTAVLLERMVAGVLRPDKNDVGMQFAVATWRLILHLSRSGDPEPARRIWAMAVAHHTANEGDRWIGLRFNDPLVAEALDCLKRLGDLDTLKSARRVLGGRNPTSAARPSIWKSILNLFNRRP